MIKKNATLISLLFLFSFNLSISSAEIEEAIKLRYQGKFEEAIKVLKSSKFLGDTDSELLLAKLYLDTGLYSEANQLYERLCKSINTYECFNEYGISLMSNLNYNTAIENFEKSISINPQFSTAYSNLAMCYTIIKDFNNAEKYNLKALEISPNNPIIRINYGVYLIKIKKYQRSKDILYPVIAENESMYFAELFIGIAHYFKEEYNSSLIHFNRGININPEFSDLYYHRALLYYKKGDYQNSIRDLQMVEKLTPNSVKVIELRKLIKLSGRI